MDNPSILVGNRTGGQGKTLISQLIHYGFKLSGSELTTVAADTSEAGDLSKLGSLIPGTVELGTGASISDVKENQHRVVQYWDKLGKFLLEGNCVIDLGANILPVVFQWAEERNAGRLLLKRDLVLVLPITVQKQSIDDATDALEMVISHSAVLPFRRIVVVLNEYHGSFGGVVPKPVNNIISFKKVDVSIVTLTKANVEFWDQIESIGVPLEVLANMDYEAYVSKFKANEFAALGAERTMKRWIFSSINDFQSVGLIPCSDPDLVSEDGAEFLDMKSSAVAS